MKKILITGSTGFIGSNLLSLLYDKNKIFLLIRSKKDIIKIKRKYPKLKCIYFNSYKILDARLKKIEVTLYIKSVLFTYT